MRLLEADPVTDGQERVTLSIHGANLDIQDGEFRRNLAKLLDETTKSVTLVGKYRPADVPALMRDIDWVAARAAEHDAMVEHLLASAVVIPMKLFTLFSTDLLTNTYIDPVGGSLVNQETIAYLYNPNNSAITITPTSPVMVASSRRNPKA